MSHPTPAATAASPVPAEPAAAAATRRMFCTFRIGGRLFGVDILHVKEVTAEASITHVPHTPAEVLGLVNIRGHIYLALDLRLLLRMPAAPATPETRLVLFKPSVGHAFGVAVDQIADIEAVEPERLGAFAPREAEAAGAGVGRVDLIDAVAQLPDELLVVLTPSRFLAVVENTLSQDAP